ncbi:biotin--[acetyl-CoA-carboxylase] ligase [Algivirga pacifica]|uniref:biotin--[biotin carboxyl-carrier protein] ligase n=2 Tax=Algivirga pacifica TaxID=1162670 RepID=A0ABP9D2T9_9BACT
MLQKGPVIEGTIIYTPEQTAGRGQRGNQWEAKANKNLTFSMILKPTFLQAQEQFQLNVAVSLGIMDFFREVIGLSVKVKWPNDIYVEDRKICGILIENFLHGNSISHAIIGIGINVNQQVFDHPKATSIALEVGKQYKLESLLEEIAQYIEARYLKLKNQGYLALKTAYLQSLYWYQEVHQFERLTEVGKGTIFEGSILGIDTHGKLILQSEKGLETFGLKEIRFHQ